jgi:TonB family protein
MTRTIVAILALAQGMLFAQSKSPAQPSSTPVLQSALLQPAAFSAFSAKDNTATSSTGKIRISSLVAPKLIQSVSLTVASSPRMLATDSTVVLDLTVDESGKPTHIQVAESANPSLDQEVVAAVSQFRYKPGTLDGQPTAFPVKLHYTVKQGSSY